MATQSLTNLSVANAPKKETVAETYARGKAVLASDPAGINKPRTVTPVSTKDVSTVITSDQLEGAAGNDIKLPEQPKVQKFETGITPETVAADQQTELQRLQAENEKQKAAVKAGFDSQAGMGEFEDKISEDVGLQAKRVEKTKYDNMILAKQREQDLAIRDAQDAPGTRAQKNAIISEITKNTNRELADLSIIQMAKAGEFNDAQAYVNRKVELEFADRKANLEGLKFLYTENKDRLTLVEQREFDKTIQAEQRTYDEARQKAQAFEDLKLGFIKQAVNNGAGPAVLSAIQGATDQDALMSVPGIEALKDPMLELQKEQARASTAASWALANERLGGGETFTTEVGTQLKVPTFEDFIAEKESELKMSLAPQAREKYRKEYEDEKIVMEQALRISTLSPTAKEVVNNPQAYYDLTPTVRGEIFAEMARNGVDTNAILSGKKKSLPATQAESLAQASGVKSDVEKLYTMLKELPGTGPISGRLQALDPYNAKRVAIEAQITRIVPGLARGIFNEVGVLTDNDVKRYRETLANPNMTDEQIEALHRDTMSKIDESIGTTIDTFSSLGYDLGTYGQNETKVDTLSDDEAYAEYLKITKQ